MAIRLRPIPRTDDPREVEKWRNEIRKKISELNDMLAIAETHEVLASGATSGDNGNWKLVVSGTNLLIQRKEAGTWTTKETIAA